MKIQLSISHYYLSLLLSALAIKEAMQIRVQQSLLNFQTNSIKDY